MGFASVYGLAALLLKRQQGLYILRQAFFALAVLFLTIAVPLYFEPSNTVILWSAESALVYFFGLRQQRPHIRLGALMVYLLAALIQLGNYQGFGTDTVLEGQWFYDDCGVAWRSGDLFIVEFLASRRFGAMGKIRSDGRVVCRLAVHLYFAFAFLGRPRQHCRSLCFGSGVGILPAQT